MTPLEFAGAVRLYCLAAGGSITSWGRTEKHSIAVGGFAGDPHTRWMGADVVYDTPLTVDIPRRESLARDLNLQILHESSHDHLQDHK